MGNGERSGQEESETKESNERRGWKREKERERKDDVWRERKADACPSWRLLMPDWIWMPDLHGTMG